MVVISAKCLEVFRYNNLLKLPAGVMCGKTSTHYLDHLFLKRPPIMIEHPFAIPNVHMGALMATLPFMNTTWKSSP